MFFKQRTCRYCGEKDLELSRLKTNLDEANQEIARLNKKLDSVQHNAEMRPTKDHLEQLSERMDSDESLADREEKRRQAALTYGYNGLYITLRDDIDVNNSDHSLDMKAEPPSTEKSQSKETKKFKMSDEDRAKLEEKRRALKAKLPESETISREKRLLLAKEAQVKLLKVKCREHYSALTRNLRKSLVYNDYGALTSDSRRAVAMDFLNSIGIRTKAIGGSEAIDIVINTVSELQRELEEKGFTTENLPEDGLDFEHWVAEALERHGWQARVTTGSGDQGVDVIAQKGGFQWAIQCKRYSQPVGNKAVQEAFSGAKYYGADKGAVLSNAGFTESAKQLAISTGVQLLSPEDIPALKP